MDRDPSTEFLEDLNKSAMEEASNKKDNNKVLYEQEVEFSDNNEDFCTICKSKHFLFLFFV